jgi:hypothetical protein
VAADPPQLDPPRRRPGREVTDLLGAHLGPSQVGDPQLNHLGNLPLLATPGHWCGQPGQERGDPEPGGLGLHHRQRGQQLDPVPGQADLLVGLPQGGGGQVGVPGIALAAVGAIQSAPGPSPPPVAVPAPVHRDQHRRLAQHDER